MEHRREHRFPTEQPVNLTVLLDPETHMSAMVKNASGRGLGLICPKSVLSGSAVKIEFGDLIFLGEAMYCRPAEGGYYVGIELTEVLTGLAALSRMALVFSEELDAAARLKTEATGRR